MPSVDPLPIRSLEFLGGMAQAGGWRPPSGLPEVAFAGRSNVGKSSLLNRLVRRRALARVSRTPGRTQEINFFRVNDAFILVDLPGYGYARVSKERREQWRPLIEGYLSSSPGLRGVVQLIDARHEPTADDRAMLDFLAGARRSDARCGDEDRQAVGGCAGRPASRACAPSWASTRARSSPSAP